MNDLRKKLKSELLSPSPALSRTDVSMESCQSEMSEMSNQAGAVIAVITRGPGWTRHLTPQQMPGD